MNPTDIIRKYIAENILYSNNGYSYPNEASFLEEGIIDSTSVLDLVLFVEEKFGISVEDEEITPENFDSVNQIVGFVQQKTC
jgi:acyl carrier protein